MKQLCVAPDIIERLHATWVRLRSQMIRSVEAGSEITKLLVGWDDRFLRTEADVVAALQKLIHDKSIRHCSECSRVCAERWGLAAAREHLVKSVLESCGVHLVPQNFSPRFLRAQLVIDTRSA